MCLARGLGGKGAEKLLHAQKLLIEAAAWVQ
jgi:hypothetical protein